MSVVTVKDPLQSQFDGDVGSIQMKPSRRLQVRLEKHQKFFLKWQSFHPFAMLGDEMGLGKTISSIAVIARKVDELGDAAKILVIAPAGNLYDPWLEQLKAILPSVVVFSFEKNSNYDDIFEGRNALFNVANVVVVSDTGLAKATSKMNQTKTKRSILMKQVCFRNFIFFTLIGLAFNHQG